MNDYFGLIISILLVVDALQFFMNKGRIVERSRNKYTEASFTVYRKVFGSVLLIAAVACFISSMGALGFINMGENFSGDGSGARNSRAPEPSPYQSAATGKQIG